MLTLVIIFLGLAVAYWYQRWHDHQYLDGRTFPNGKTHQFVIGDNLRLYGGGQGAFKRGQATPWYTLEWMGGSHYYGLGMLLDKHLPQLYLDSRKGGGHRARYIIDSKQRISLEGDFDKYFNLYAPRGAEALALSIVTPDVMETLMAVAGEYDIELYRDRLRIISAKPVFRHKDRQAEMLVILDKLVIELDHRLQSWQDLAPGEEPRLTMRPFRGVRLFGRYVPAGLMLYELLWLLGAAFFTLLAFVEFRQPQESGAGWVMVMVAALFVAVAVGVHLFVYKRSRFQPYD